MFEEVSLIPRQFPNHSQTRFSHEQTIVSICYWRKTNIQLQIQEQSSDRRRWSDYLCSSNVQVLHRGSLPERNSQVTGVLLALKHS